MECDGSVFTRAHALKVFHIHPSFVSSRFSIFYVSNRIHFVWLSVASTRSLAIMCWYACMHWYMTAFIRFQTTLFSYISHPYELSTKGMFQEMKQHSIWVRTCEVEKTKAQIFHKILIFQLHFRVSTLNSKKEEKNVSFQSKSWRH